MTRINDIAVAAGIQPIGSQVVIVNDSGATKTIAYPPAFKPFPDAISVPSAVTLWNKVYTSLSSPTTFNTSALKNELQQINLALNSVRSNPDMVMKYRGFVGRLLDGISNRSKDLKGQFTAIAKDAVEIDAATIKGQCPGVQLHADLITAREEQGRTRQQLQQRLTVLQTQLEENARSKTRETQQLTEQHRAALGALQQQLDAVTRSGGEKDAQIAQLTQQIGELETAVAARQAEKNSAAAARNAARAELRTTSEARNTASAQADARARLIEGLRAEAAARTQEIAALRAAAPAPDALAQRDARIAELQATIDAAQAQLAQRNARIAELQAQAPAAEAPAAVRARQRQLADAQGQVAAVQEQLTAAQAELEQLRSYRVTANTQMQGLRTAAGKASSLIGKVSKPEELGRLTAKALLGQQAAFNAARDLRTQQKVIDGLVRSGKLSESELAALRSSANADAVVQRLAGAALATKQQFDRYGYTPENLQSFKEAVKAPAPAPAAPSKPSGLSLGGLFGFGGKPAAAANTRAAGGGGGAVRKQVGEGDVLPLAQGASRLGGGAAFSSSSSSALPFVPQQAGVARKLERAQNILSGEAARRKRIAALKQKLTTDPSSMTLARAAIEFAPEEKDFEGDDSIEYMEWSVSPYSMNGIPGLTNEDVKQALAEIDKGQGGGTRRRKQKKSKKTRRNRRS